MPEGQGATPDNSGATPGSTGQQGATPGGQNQPVSQGPNDPINPQRQGARPNATDDGTQQDQSSVQRLEEAIRRERELRQQAEAREKALREKDLPEADKKWQTQIDEANRTAKERERRLTLRYEIASRGAKIGIVDPEVAVMLLESNPSIVIDPETNAVTGLDEAIKALVKERPYLVGAGAAAAAGDATAGTRGGGSKAGAGDGMNDMIRRRARQV